MAAGLMARGFEPGDRVAIMSRTRYEWTLLRAMAALCARSHLRDQPINQVAHVLLTWTST